jgi:hypothetical protein
MGTNGPIISKERGGDIAAVGVGVDGALEVVDEYEEEERTEHTPLGYTILDCRPVGMFRGVYTAHSSVGEERINP